MYRNTFGIVALLMLLIVVNFSEARIITVTPATEGLQDLIDSAGERDTLLFEHGVYITKLYFFNKNMTIGSLDMFGQMNPPASNTTIFDGMYIDDDGRALITIENSEITVIGLSIINNVDDIENPLGKGGGLSCDNSTVTVRDCNISNHQCHYGGAVYAQSSTLAISNCTIENNYSIIGAGIYSSREHIEVNYCRLDNNLSRHLDGGTIAIFGSTGSIRNSQISNGSARIWGGGAFLRYCNDFEISDNIWANNTSDIEGGAITIRGGENLAITRNVFSSNSAGGDGFSGRGSAISALNAERVLIRYNTFVSNKSRGAVSIYNGDYSFRNNMFINNMGFGYTSLDISGMNGEENLSLLAYNNAFKYSRHPDNTRWNYSGAVCAREGSELTLTNNDFINNEGYAVGQTNSPGEVNLHNNFWGSSTGPYHQNLSPFAQGDTLHTDISYDSFATEPNWQYGLVFGEEVIDFGEVEIGETTTENLELTNITVDTLFINLFEFFHDNCFTLSGMDSLIVNAGETVTIPVSFSPSEETNYFDILSTVSTNYRATGTTIEVLGVGILDTEVEEDKFIPTSFNVGNAYPNPFNNKTTVKISLDQKSTVNLSVYDINGRIVRKLSSEKRQAGNHKYTLDFSGLSTGIYLLNVKTEKYSETRKLMLIQ